jgi:beta-lactamase class A
MLTRRNLLALALAAAYAGPVSAASFRSIQKRVGGRLGVYVLDSQSGKKLAFNDDMRFAMASTFKLPLVAALLWQVDHGAFPLTDALPIDREDLVANSPVVEAGLAQGMTAMSVHDLCAAALVYSDNAAANVLLAGIGGPAALTTFVRSIGDQTTQFDRTEPELNSNLPDDPRDTTTPRAMVETMLKIFTQDALSLTSRALLIDWMSRARTGLDRVRAGLPKSWQSADKTGTGQNGAYNDLVATWPPQRRPILIAVYMSGSTLAPKELSAAQEDIGTMIGQQKWP